MLEVAWEELDPGAPGLARARLELHHAVQLVAAVGQALAPRAEDDSQQSLSVGGDGIWLGAPVAGGTLRAALDPMALELLLVSVGGPPPARLSLAGRTLADGLAFLAGELRRSGVTGALELPRHPADFAAHALARGASFEAGEPAARRELARLFSGSRGLLSAIVGPSAPLRLWPHHFDLAGSLTVGRNSLGLGVSPGEGKEGLPYWYATFSPALPREGLPTLDGAGAWRTEGWMGAELRSGRLQRGAAAQRAQVAAFYRSAIAAADPAAA